MLVIGGSDEMSLHLMQGVDQATSEIDKFSALHLDPSLDVKPKHRRQVDEEDPTFHETNQSYLRRLYAEEMKIEKLRELTVAGVQGHRVTQAEVEMVQNCSAF